MQTDALDLRDLLEYQPDGGVLRFGGERVLLIDATAFGLLRKDLIETFGFTAAKGLLIRFGFAHGWRVAESLSRQLPLGSELDVGLSGGHFHQLLGLVVSHFEQQADGDSIRVSWQDSFEVEQQLLHFGLSDDKVCWTLCGFASGWLSFCRGEKAYCLEESCRGRGDAACVMVVKSAGQWGPEFAHDLAAYDKECLDASLKRIASEIKQTERKLRQVRDLVPPPGRRPVAQSQVMCKIRDVAARVAKTDTTVLLTGESGSGKEVVARFIHEQSPRSARPFIAVNCGALPENLLESELFGHARGAFTGASQARVGLFEAAQGGTLFLDEVGDMTPATQVNVLRALQEREIRRVGENTSRPVDVRVLAATNRDLAAEMAAGRFRPDLYYRLRVVELVIPPLRERPDDILPLARHFLELGGKRLNQERQGFEPAAAHALLRHPWPGNVRELQNVIERAVVLSPGPKVGLDDLPDELRQPVPAAKAGTDLTLAEVEKAHILAVLQAARWNRTAAARQLGIGHATLFRKLRQYGKLD
jgi:two-component system, NtrC family, response regulator HydG